MDDRTPAYWPTRIRLAVGLVATVIALALSLALLTEPSFDRGPDILGLPGNLVVGLVGAVGALAGFAWMLRIFRGPRDEPPAWRHRDR
jgi:drug/metabolite transporter (DMT)-like permease